MSVSIFDAITHVFFWGGVEQVLKTPANEDNGKGKLIYLPSQEYHG